MIGIQIEDDPSFLETKEDTSIDLTLENPLFATADILSPGSYSLPFKVPSGESSPVNMRLLKNPDVIENNNSFQPLKSKLWYDGSIFKSGIIKQLSFTNRESNNYFTFGLNSIIPDLKTAKIRDIVDQQIDIPDTELTKLVYVKWLAFTGARTIYVNGREYTDTAWTYIANAVNSYSATIGLGKAVPHATVVDVGGPDTPGGMAAEYIIIKLVVFTAPGVFVDCTDVLEPLSVTIRDNFDFFQFESDAFTAYYIAYATFMDDYLSGTYALDSIRFPAMFNAGLYDEDIKENEIVNGKGVSGLILNDPNLVGKNRNSIQPFLRLKWVLDTIASTYGISMEGDFYDDLATNDRLIDNSYTLDVMQKYMGIDTQPVSKFIFWRSTFNLRELIPDLSVVEFFKQLCGRYNLAVYQSEVTGNIRLKKLEQVARSNEYDDITSISSPVTSGEDQRIAGFKIAVAKDESDELSVEETITVGTPEIEVKIACGRLHQTGSLLWDTGTIIGPRVKRLNQSSFSLRFFHYKGIVDNGVFTYAAADLHGAAFYEALNTSGMNIGIYDSSFKYWMYFVTRRFSIKLKVNFPFRRLLKFNHELKRRFDRSNFLVKSIRVVLTNQNVNVSEVELYTMR